ncbi:hypothetical protein CEXT_450261 [Caerostris extrusa]|uniref:Uncharacterized protein n=1 Tax=Caerostris extrusa TaxID=172846 RepID=A0AAV4P6L0_CAEEX|nr:hypothetical protein CEXT_450261 [Caerostris extrusa]
MQVSFAECPRPEKRRAESPESTVSCDRALKEAEDSGRTPPGSQRRLLVRDRLHANESVDSLMLARCPNGGLTGVACRSSVTRAND